MNLTEPLVGPFRKRMGYAEKRCWIWAIVAIATALIGAGTFFLIVKSGPMTPFFSQLSVGTVIICIAVTIISFAAANHYWHRIRR